jgi:hypothetical protein
MNKFLLYIKNFFSLESVADKLNAFLCGNEALPKPLSIEEESYFILKKEQGDEEAKKF